MTHTSGTTGIPKLICHSAHSMGWRTKWQKQFSQNFGKEINRFSHLQCIPDSILVSLL